MSTEAIASIVVPIVLAIFGSTGFWTWVQSKTQKKTAEKKVLMGLAYSEIIRSAEEHIARGYIASDDYNELDHYLYQPYKEMGGDGTAERMMNQVKALPSKPKKEQEEEKHD